MKGSHLRLAHYTPGTVCHWHRGLGFAGRRGTFKHQRRCPDLNLPAHCCYLILGRLVELQRPSKLISFNNGVLPPMAFQRGSLAIHTSTRGRYSCSTSHRVTSSDSQSEVAAENFTLFSELLPIDDWLSRKVSIRWLVEHECRAE